MISLVLQRLESLHAELARLDPTCEIGAAAQVDAMVVALRDVAAEAKTPRKPAKVTRQTAGELKQAGQRSPRRFKTKG